MSSKAKKPAKKVFKQLVITEQPVVEQPALAQSTPLDEVVHEGTVFKDAIQTSPQVLMVEDKTLEVPSKQPQIAVDTVETTPHQQQHPTEFRVEETSIPKSQTVIEPQKQEAVEQFVVTLEEKKQKGSKPTKKQVRKKPNMFEMPSVESFEQIHVEQEKDREIQKKQEQYVEPVAEKQLQPQSTQAADQSSPQPVIEVVQQPVPVRQVAPDQEADTFDRMGESMKEVETVVVPMQKPSRKKATEKKTGRNQKKKMLQQIWKQQQPVSQQALVPSELPLNAAINEPVKSQQSVETDLMVGTVDATNPLSGLIEPPMSQQFTEISQATNEMAESLLRKEQREEEAHKPVVETVVEEESVQEVHIALQTVKSKKKQEQKPKKKAKHTVLVDTFQAVEVDQIQVGHRAQQPRAVTYGEPQAQIQEQQPRTEKNEEERKIADVKVESSKVDDVKKEQLVKTEQPSEGTAKQQTCAQKAVVPLSPQQTAVEVSQILDQTPSQMVQMPLITKTKKVAKKANSKPTNDSKKKKIITTNIDVRETVEQPLIPNQLQLNTVVQNIHPAYPAYKEPQCQNVKLADQDKLTQLPKQMVFKSVMQEQKLLPTGSRENQTPKYPVAKSVGQIAQRVTFKPCYTERQNQIRQTVQMMSEDILSRKLNRVVMASNVIESPIIDQYIDQNVRLKREYMNKCGGNMPDRLM